MDHAGAFQGDGSTITSKGVIIVNHVRAGEFLTGSDCASDGSAHAYRRSLWSLRFRNALACVSSGRSVSQLAAMALSFA